MITGRRGSCRPQIQRQPAVLLHTSVCVVFFFSQQVKDKRTLKTVWQAALPDAEGSGPSARRTGDWVFPLG